MYETFGGNTEDYIFRLLRQYSDTCSVHGTVRVSWCSVIAAIGTICVLRAAVGMASVGCISGKGKLETCCGMEGES